MRVLPHRHVGVAGCQPHADGAFVHGPASNRDHRDLSSLRRTDNAGERGRFDVGAKDQRVTCFEHVRDRGWPVRDARRCLVPRCRQHMIGAERAAADVDNKRAAVGAALIADPSVLRRRNSSMGAMPRATYDSVAAPTSATLAAALCSSSGTLSRRRRTSIWYPIQTSCVFPTVVINRSEQPPSYPATQGGLCRTRTAHGHRQPFESGAREQDQPTSTSTHSPSGACLSALMHPEGLASECGREPPLSHGSSARMTLPLVRVASSEMML